MKNSALEKRVPLTDGGDMVDRRALPGFCVGLLGLAFGVAAVVLRMPLMGYLAGACALAAGAASIVLVQRLVQSEAKVAASAVLTNLLDLPQQAREQAHSLIDEETRLPDGRFLELAIDGRVAAARRHLWPVTVVLLEVGLRPECTEPADQSAAIVEFAHLLRGALREADVVCRTTPTGFALVLEDTAEEGGVWVAERVQIAMAQEGGGARRLAAGVASYPTHGLESDDVLARAQAALTRACAAGAGRGLGQVEVAQPDFA